MLVVKGHYVYSKGFRYNKVASVKPGAGNYQAAITHNPLLDQPYYYLGKGRQTYAFESADQKYVLKFTRYHKYAMPLWARIYRHLPFTSSFLDGVLFEKRERKKRAFESYYIAKEFLGKSTGVVQLGLYPCINPQIKVLVYFGKSRKVQVDLSKTSYVLQKKAAPLEKELLHLQAENGSGKINKLIGSFIKTFATRMRKGILNRDYMNALRNCGCSDENVIEVDIGSFYYAKDFDYARELKISTAPFKEFLRERLPEYLSYFEQELDDEIQAASK